MLPNKKKEDKPFELQELKGETEIKLFEEDVNLEEKEKIDERPGWIKIRKKSRDPRPKDSKQAEA